MKAAYLNLSRCNDEFGMFNIRETIRMAYDLGAKHQLELSQKNMNLLDCNKDFEIKTGFEYR